MVDRTIASEEMTGLLKNWYVYMIDQDTENANRKKIEVDTLSEKIEEDPALYTYYSLLDFRHKILMRQFDQATFQLKKIDELKEHMNHQLFYYYYFFKGLLAFSKKKYDEAIKNYQVAEKLLKIITDPIDRAEFHYKAGAAYFQLDYLSFALNHAQQALDIFESKKRYKKRCISCKVLLAQSYKDLGQLEHALFYYQEALFQNKELNDQTLKNIINENLGELYSQKGNINTAITYFKQSLEKNNRTDHILSTLYVLSKEYFKSDKITEAMHWLNKGIDLSSNNEGYYYHFKILKSTYIASKNLEQVLVESINYFKNEQLWHYVEEYANGLADYYYQQKAYQKAVMYYRLVIKAKNFTSLKGGIQK
jgi:tetratricopeptide (TPR) repeat protein